MTVPVDGRAGARSHELFTRARARIPGGVNSPVRAFAAVGQEPPFAASGRGCRVYTEDGGELLDYIGSWGPAILGHAHPEVVEAVRRAAGNGFGFGIATAAEVELAELLCELVPNFRGGRVRLVSSGTEATMSALRLARGATGRTKIVKIDGGYHGHADLLLAAAGSGVATFGLPGSAGVPPAAVADTLVLPFNDPSAAGEAFARHPDDIAAVIVEPVAGNMGCVPPAPGYLAALRELTRRHGALLVFDEVMTGFRVALGGAQERFDVLPDLTCIGKIAGGGLPLAAYGGRADLMDHVAPLGPVYQAGTLSGNPLAVAAGRATLEILRRDPPYTRLEAAAGRIAQGLAAAGAAAGVPVTIQGVGAMFTVFFHGAPVPDYAAAKRCALPAFARWHAALLQRGVLWPPSQFEAAFLGTAHDGAALDATIAAATEAFTAAASA
jgi:glutamate-1-semialdehyde 2,1-aminomutase